MNSNKKYIYLFVFIVLASLFMLNACRKDQIPTNAPKVITNNATDIGESTATLNASVNPNNLSTMVSFEYGPTNIYGNIILSPFRSLIGHKDTLVTVNLTSLSPNTVYHFRAKAINSLGTAYGEDLSFSTITIPTIGTNSIYYASTSSISSGGNIISDGGSSITARGICWNTSPNPTVDNSKILNGTGLGSFTSVVDGLSVNTTYFLRAFATNKAGTVYGDENSFTLWLNQPGPPVQDVDGNQYTSVKIGRQIWLVENLKTTHYSDRSKINLITDNNIWLGQTTGAYGWYNNDSSSYKNTYGALYNWYAASDNRSLCPIGWHVPTRFDLVALDYYLRGSLVSGGSLKEIGTTHWSIPNTGATNVSGFSALPGGIRLEVFLGVNNRCNFWSSNDATASGTWCRELLYNSANFTDIDNGRKAAGMSVRCLKD